MLILLLTHLLTALATGALARRLGSRVFIVALIAPVATLAWLASKASEIAGDRVIEETVRWLPQLDLVVGLRLDGFGFLMAVLIAGIGAAVFAYSASYFGPRPDLGRLAALLVLFAGSMLGVVLADNILALYAFWELTSVTSFGLIGIDDERAGARAAALQAILVTGTGGLAMLGGFVVLGQAAGTYSLAAIVADPPGGPAVAVALVLVLAGALTKSAQVPFHFWLPAAMAAPTPISAYLHSATMVKAGVYLIARLAPAFAPAVAFWRPLVVGIGLVTMLVGGYEALRRHDLKALLAYGTVSQLGFLVALVGFGAPALSFAGVAMLAAHALFKAPLFLVTGIIDHHAHTRDLRRLTGLARRMPLLAAVAAGAAASMAGLPPLLGFVAKEAAVEGVLELGGTGGWLMTGGIAAGSVLTVAYTARFLWGAFGDRMVLGEPEPPIGAPAARFVAPAAVLVSLSAGAGVVPAAAGTLVAPAAEALAAGAGELHLQLWHGFTPALGLSVVIVAAGWVLFRLRAAGAPVSQRWLPVAADLYRETVRWLNVLADRMTGVVQNGSLPVYLGVILLCLVLLPGSRLLEGAALPGGLQLAASPLQAVVAAVVTAAAIATAALSRRFAAVLALGTVGYGVAVLFVIQGAPDLALTQLLIETLAVVIFLLVLRHLPERFEPVGWAMGQGLRLVIAIAVGGFVTVFALIAGASRTADPVSAEIAARALPEGGGRNIVNVILVDFRGFDTLGEITVLAVAALGITALVLAGRQAPPAAPPEARPVRWRDSLILDTGVALVFPPALLLSLFLLLTGHDAPGGGFVGGLVLGAALVLRYLAGGSRELARRVPIAPRALLGAGLAVAVGTGAAPWLAGKQFLDRGELAAHLPLVGEIHTSSALLFDIGVYLVVVGLVLAILETLGAEAET